MGNFASKVARMMAFKESNRNRFQKPLQEFHIKTTTDIKAEEVKHQHAATLQNPPDTRHKNEWLDISNRTRSPSSAPAIPLDITETIDTIIERIITDFKSEKKRRSFCVKPAELNIIFHKAREIFLSQPTLLKLDTPVKIAGDIHGQFRDLLRLLRIGGDPSLTNYLFLGDYVDRGKESLETVTLLLCYKIKYPERFFMLRGNHECADINRIYGFYDECKRRSSIKIWKGFTDVFNCLPVAAIIADKVFCVHGGLSPHIHNSLDVISEIQRPTTVPAHGLLGDLLWSDPNEKSETWQNNDRGVSYTFGKAILESFLDRFDFDLVVRAHMVVEDGYEFFGDRQLVTVFSAPNYCNQFDNAGAIMTINNELVCAFHVIPACMQGLQFAFSERRRSNGEIFKKK